MKYCTTGKFNIYSLITLYYFEQNLYFGAKPEHLAIIPGTFKIFPKVGSSVVWQGN